jgi:magnesium chelatase family protein
MPVDRIDIHVDVPPVHYAELASTVTTENSATIRARVNAARALQRARFTGTATPRIGVAIAWGDARTVADVARG